MALLTGTEDIKRVLRESKSVAVLGANVKESKAAHYVPRYLYGEGYTIYPVNPVHDGKTLFGEPFCSNLRDLQRPIDVVDVFRRSEALSEHLEDFLAMEPRPKVVWFQSGIRHDEVAQELSDAGIDVIQSRCMLADHQRLL